MGTGYNVITSITAGDSGEVSLSSAYTAESEGGTTKEGMSSGEGAVIVGLSVLTCCVLGVLYFALCHRYKKQVISERVDDEDTVIQKEEGYDMTTNGVEQKRYGAQGNETETMIEVQISETKQ